MLDWLAEAALRSVALAAITWCILTLLRIRQPRLLLASWTIVLLVSVAMPGIPRLIPIRLAFDPAIPGPLMDRMADLLTPLPDSGPVTDAPMQGPAWPGMETVYVVICCSMLSRVLLGLVLSARLLVRAIPVRPAWTAGQRLRISRDVSGPVTIARVILLPADAMVWSADTREAVLAHERAHVARWDFAMLVLSQLHRAVFWFSPLPWWLHRRLVTLSELAGDDQAMATTGDRLGYAEILLEMGRRSGSVFRGPAMARPSTLLHRIDRILMEQEQLRPPSRAQHAVLIGGMVGLSLGIASMACDTAPELATPSRAFKLVRASGQVEDARAVILPHRSADARVGSSVSPVIQSAPPALSQAPSTRVPGVKPPRPIIPAPSPLSRMAARTLPLAPAPPATNRPNSFAAMMTETSEHAETEARGTGGGAPPITSGSGVAAKPSAPAASEPVPPSQLAGGSSSSLDSRLEEIAGSTCTGVVKVGMQAAGGVPGRPDVVPGQAVPAHAQFFRKDGGALWVRFNAFGRPPLDLPVRFARNGITWTGEFGIAYMVQAAGGGRLAGLASLVANDSAGLSFGCSRSTSRPV